MGRLDGGGWVAEENGTVRAKRGPYRRVESVATRGMKRIAESDVAQIIDQGIRKEISWSEVKARIDELMAEDEMRLELELDYPK